MCQEIHSRPRDVMEGFPTYQRTPRTEGSAQTCRAIIHCRTGHRRLNSMTEELGSSDLPIRFSASLFILRHCEI